MIDYNLVPMGAVVGRVGDYKAYVLETRSIKTCAICEALARPQKMIRAEKKGRELGYCHTQCYTGDPKLGRTKAINRYTPRASFPRTDIVKPVDMTETQQLLQTLTRAVELVCKTYTSINFNVTKLEEGYRLTCIIGKAERSDIYINNWSKNTVKRRVMELLAITLKDIDDSKA